MGYQVHNFETGHILMASEMNALENQVALLSELDSVPTEGSEHLLTSGAIHTALQQLAVNSPDSTPTANSTKLITSGGVKAALDEIEARIDAIEIPSEFNVDDAPTDDSVSLVTSGGVKAALDLKANIFETDEAPTLGSSNLVTSGGVKAALNEMLNQILDIRYEILDIKADIIYLKSIAGNISGGGGGGSIGGGGGGSQEPTLSITYDETTGTSEVNLSSYDPETGTLYGDFSYDETTGTIST